MVILITKNSKTHSEDSVEWPKETDFQDFVVENCQIIFSQFDKDSKIIPIGRELVNENGRADIIFLDQNGSLYIVEAKLDSNNNKRSIFAQLTGYMSAVRNQSKYQTFEHFINDCEKSIQNKFEFSGTFDEYLQQEFELDKKSIIEIKNNLKNNIENNSVFGIIIMDFIENSFKLDIDYQLSNNFKICGIELQKHLENDTFFVVPQYYGLEKLFLDSRKDPSWYKKHVEGWYIFNEEIQKNQELDENTKKKYSKTYCLVRKYIWVLWMGDEI